MKTHPTLAPLALAAVLGFGGLLGFAGCSEDSKSTTMPMPGGETTGEQAFRNDMRKLWEDHITWTRMYIVSAAADLPDLGATANRLLANQEDIGTAIKPFYGDAAGEQLTSLLRSHILTAADLISAAKAGNTDGTQKASVRWYANADSIASFLNGANPQNWPLDDMKQMMKDHLDLTLEEAVDRLHGDYEGDIAAYDKVHDEILKMADMLSDGILAQFPDRVQ
ncbi:MAG: hypothetical protein ACE15D_19200 [Candidatus Eisenbacteria bacterium]